MDTASVSSTATGSVRSLGHCLSLAVLKTGDFSDVCDPYGSAELKSSSPEGFSDYSYSSNSNGCHPQVQTVDQDGGPSGSSSSAWKIGNSPPSVSRNDAFPELTQAYKNQHSPQSVRLDFGELPEITSDMKGLRCDAILASLFEQHPELQAELLDILDDERSSDNEYLRHRVQGLFGEHKPVIAALNAELLTTKAKPNALRTTLCTASLRLQSVHSLKNDSSLLEGQGTAGKRKQRRQSMLTTASRWTPPKEKRYLPWFTALIILVITSIFFFMAGSQALDQNPDSQGGSPRDLRLWLSFRSNEQYMFKFDFLLLWGGQYLPAIKQSQGWRWITAAFIHTSFQHMFANMLLLAVLGGMLEVRYGPWRILILTTLATFGAAFFSGMFADACSQVVGSSGAVLGFVGLTIADLLINFRNIWHTCVRLCIILAAVIFFIVTAVTKAGEYTSNWSHLGGFVCGLFPAFAFIPDFNDERWQNAHKLSAFLGRNRKTSLPRRRKSGLTENRLATEDFAEARQAGGNSVTIDDVQLNPTFPFANQGAEIMDTAIDMEAGHAHTNSVVVQIPDRAASSQERALPVRKGKWKQCMNLCFIGNNIHLWIGLAIIVAVFTIFPTYIYLHRLKHLSCSR